MNPRNLAESTDWIAIELNKLKTFSLINEIR